MSLDLEKYQREDARWRILVTLNLVRPHDATEGLVLRALHDSKHPMTPRDLRRELDYLEDRKLVTIAGRNSPEWFVGLTHYGVDIVEYTIDCFPGIARPVRWF